MIFRVLMFMLPGAAFFAAAALLPQVRTLTAMEKAAAQEATRQGTAVQEATRQGTAVQEATRQGAAAQEATRQGTAVQEATRQGTAAQEATGQGTAARRRATRRTEPLRYAWLPPLALLAATLAFVPSYSGKDRVSYFPPAEVDLVRQVIDQAPDGSLVVASDRNYPLAFAEYWRVDHYWFLDDDRSHVDRIVRDPAATLARDMSSVEPPGRAYLLFTRGQFANAEMNGLLTKGQLGRIERSVAASPLFERVADNDAGSAYVLKDVPKEAGR
jgi:hypothetical protein